MIHKPRDNFGLCRNIFEYSYKGQSITYDKIGNPLNYRDGFSFGWSGGRKLTTVYLNNGSVYMTGEYRYDDNGIRTYKEVNGNITRYYLDGSTILAEETNYGGITRRVDYVYDETGSIYGFFVGGKAYYYQKNLQGDITGILDANGSLLVEYIYDAYGVPTTRYVGITDSLSDLEKQEIYILGSNNPFRYRGYYYDTETGFYYLNSRYYDPQTGRFLNADGYVSTGQGVLCQNMFAYCLNNPVNYIDPTGNKPGDLFDTMDEAALDFAMCYNESSIADMQEYGSAIYLVTTFNITYPKTPGYLLIFGIRYPPKVTVTKKYSYTKPNIGKNGDSVMPNFFTNNLIVSTVHTHANYDPKYDNENFSTGFASDIWWSDFFHMDSYVVTPGGYLKKYTYANRKDANGGVTVISDDIPWDPNSRDHIYEV